MGGHKRYGGGSHGGDGLSRRWTGKSAGGDGTPRMLRPISWIVVIVGLGVWSLLAWIGYLLADPILDWVATNGGLLVDGGKDLATATGGKEVGSVLDSLNVSGLMGLAIALLQMVVKPAIVVLWAIGALALMAAPFVLPRIGRLFGGLWR